MEVRSMKYDIVDICVVAAIFACTCYVWDEQSSKTHFIDVESGDVYDEDDGGEIVVDVDLAVKNTAHPARNCDACGSKGSVIVLEIAYSGLKPLTTDVANMLGDQLLEELFNQCTCSELDDLCFQWTLTINQMNYSKTDTNFCRGSGSTTCSISTSEVFPGIRLNATLGEVHVVFTSVGDRTCLQKTVLCALNKISPSITDNTFVQVVISSEDYKST